MAKVEYRTTGGYVSRAYVEYPPNRDGTYAAQDKYTGTRITVRFDGTEWREEPLPR